jgi:hypothetical protein
MFLSALLLSICITLSTQQDLVIENLVCDNSFINPVTTLSEGAVLYSDSDRRVTTVVWDPTLTLHPISLLQSSVNGSLESGSLVKTKSSFMTQYIIGMESEQTLPAWMVQANWVKMNIQVETTDGASRSVTFELYTRISAAGDTVVFGAYPAADREPYFVGYFFIREATLENSISMTGIRNVCRFEQRGNRNNNVGSYLSSLMLSGTDRYDRNDPMDVWESVALGNDCSWDIQRIINRAGTTQFAIRVGNRTMTIMASGASADFSYASNLEGFNPSKHNSKEFVLTEEAVGITIVMYSVKGSSRRIVFELHISNPMTLQNMRGVCGPGLGLKPDVGWGGLQYTNEKKSFDEEHVICGSKQNWAITEPSRVLYNNFDADISRTCQVRPEGECKRREHADWRDPMGEATQCTDAPTNLPTQNPNCLHTTRRMRN